MNYGTGVEMKLNLEGKSDTYIASLQECLKHYKLEGLGKEKLKVFLKYADDETGVVENRVGMLHLLAPGVKTFLFVLHPETHATFIFVLPLPSYLLSLLPSSPSTPTLKDLIKRKLQEEFGYVIIREIKSDKALEEEILDQLDGLLWLRVREWHLSIEKICFVNLAEGLVYLQALDKSGYTTDKFL